MRGVNHAWVTLIYVAAIALALQNDGFINKAVAMILILSGFVGSLLPDIDASDSLILHGEIKGIGLFFRKALYPIVAFIAERLFNIPKIHRGITHSLLGILIVDLLLSPILYASAYLYFIEGKIDLVGFITIPLWIIIGLSIGSIFHLMEDSFTKSGVYWLLSSRRLLRGNIRTFTKKEDALAITLGIAGLIPLLIALEIGKAFLVVLYTIVAFISAYIYARCTR